MQTVVLYTKAAVGLVSVLALLLFVLTMLGRKAKSDGRALNLVGAIALGPGKQMFVVRAGKQYLFLGSAEKTLIHLASFSAQDLGEEFLAALERSDEQSDQTQPFANLFHRFYKQGGR